MKQMLKAGLLAVFLAGAITGIAAERKIVCYYESWAVYSGLKPADIRAYLCTHLIYAFVDITGDNNLKPTDAWADLPSGLDGYGKFTRLRNQSPGLKVMISVGGWDAGSTTFSQVAGDPGRRAQFVQNAVSFLQRHNFDGLDVDWEYPAERGGGSNDVQNFVSLLRELKNAFNSHGYILSAAVGAEEYGSYDIWNVANTVDFLNLMAYDYHGAGDQNTGVNAPPPDVYRDAETWISKGVPKEKLVVGLPFYGSLYTLYNAGENYVGAGATAEGQLSYNNICQNIKNGWNVGRDGDDSPYAFSGNQWVGYDDPKSIADKADYIHGRGFGGAMVWSIDQDDYAGVCGAPYGLLGTINGKLRG